MLQLASFYICRIAAKVRHCLTICHFSAATELQRCSSCAIHLGREEGKGLPIHHFADFTACGAAHCVENHTTSTNALHRHDCLHSCANLQFQWCQRVATVQSLLEFQRQCDSDIVRSAPHLYGKEVVTGGMMGPRSYNHRNLGVVNLCLNLLAKFESLA